MSALVLESGGAYKPYQISSCFAKICMSVSSLASRVKEVCLKILKAIFRLLDSSPKIKEACPINQEEAPPQAELNLAIPEGQLGYLRAMIVGKYKEFSPSLQREYCAPFTALIDNQLKSLFPDPEDRKKAVKHYELELQYPPEEVRIALEPQNEIIENSFPIAEEKEEDALELEERRRQQLHRIIFRDESEGKEEIPSIPPAMPEEVTPALPIEASASTAYTDLTVESAIVSPVEEESTLPAPKLTFRQRMKMKCPKVFKVFAEAKQTLERAINA